MGGGDFCFNDLHFYSTFPCPLYGYPRHFKLNRIVDKMVLSALLSEFSEFSGFSGFGEFSELSVK